MFCKLVYKYLHKIYNDKKNYIESNINNFVNSLSQSKKNALERWLKCDEDNENDEKIKRIKEQLKMILYNNRELVIKSKDKK